MSAGYVLAALVGVGLALAALAMARARRSSRGPNLHQAWKRAQGKSWGGR